MTVYPLECRIVTPFSWVLSFRAPSNSLITLGIQLATPMPRSTHDIMFQQLHEILCQLFKFNETILWFKKQTPLQLKITAPSCTREHRRLAVDSLYQQAIVNSRIHPFAESDLNKTLSDIQHVLPPGEIIFTNIMLWLILADWPHDVIHKTGST